MTAKTAAAWPQANTIRPGTRPGCTGDVRAELTGPEEPTHAESSDSGRDIRDCVCCNMRAVYRYWFIYLFCVCDTRHPRLHTHPLRGPAVDAQNPNSVESSVARRHRYTHLRNNTGQHSGGNNAHIIKAYLVDRHHRATDWLIYEWNIVHSLHGRIQHPDHLLHFIPDLPRIRQ